MTKEQVIKVDNNETKARAILQSLVYALEMDADTGEQINVLGLVEAALDYLEENNKMFSVGL
ncbi:hypothetical protein NSB25_26245 [Acetatifactor muris]|jgi:hypothetical protein|uniref:Uncharacterized protein n=1 Tax=Acetatifactor muris TaxID=879566 RepID=A0A2K4ZP41_9FIRM|nr:hypothetical protein [Acetatifactor muris]MCR2050738.1 hypothetical protein [Acetatifactor muris]SOY32254.1 hypothetical protein AMURIS_05012 [Acetatifactor muris]